MMSFRYLIMTELEYIKDLIRDNPVIWSIIKFLMILIMVMFGLQLVRRYLKKEISDTVMRYKAQKGIEFLGYALLIVLAVTYFSGAIKDFTIIHIFKDLQRMKKGSDGRYEGCV